MRTVTVMIGCLLLTACGCMLEDGDSAKVGDYWRGCWAEAKGNER